MKRSFLRLFLLMAAAAIGSQLTADAFIPNNRPQGQVVCDHIDESQYEIDTKIVPYSSGADNTISGGRTSIVEEFGVLYNLAQMPAGYEIPTVLKSFVMKNNISGVEIILNSGDMYNPDSAVIKKTEDGKIILIVSQNIADKPKKIVRRLMGIGDTRETQGKELHSLVDIDENDKSWSAKFARTIQKGVDKVTGEEISTKINYKKVKAQKADSFDDLFAEERMTMTIQGRGTYNVMLYGLEKAIPLDGDVPDLLVISVEVLNRDIGANDELYISETGDLYSCYVDK